MRDGDELRSETADAWSGGGAALRRRHARPLLLDDSDDEAEEGGAAKTKENEIHHQEEEERSGAVRAAPLTQVRKGHRTTNRKGCVHRDVTSQGPPLFWKHRSIRNVYDSIDVLTIVS